MTTTTHTPATLLALHDADPEGLREIACELAGWTDIRQQDYCEAHVNPYEGPVLQYWEGVSPDGEKGPLPDLHTSLDAVAELEAGLTDEEYERFQAHLSEIVYTPIHKQELPPSAVLAAFERDYISAPAHLRLIAWVLTKQTI